MLLPKFNLGEDKRTVWGVIWSYIKLLIVIEWIAVQFYAAVNLTGNRLVVRVDSEQHLLSPISAK